MGQYYGGTVSMLEHSVLNVSNTTFKNNKQKFMVNRLNTLGTNQTGGGGGAIWLSQSVGNIYESGFYNNYASIWGGAMCLVNSSLSVSDTKFENNAARVFDTKLRGGGGGAIWLYQSVANIHKSGFYNNYASIWGGAMCIVHNSSLSISYTTFENNVADVYGGAILCTHSFLNAENSNFKNNSVLEKLTGMGGCLFTENSIVKISDVLFSECHAHYGGAIMANFTEIKMADSSLIANTGSAIFFLDRESLDINNCTFLNNSTPDDGGAAIACKRYCDVKMVNSNFIGNKAVSGGGGAVYMKCIDEVRKLVVHNCSFAYNIADSGGVMSVGNSDVSISESNFSNNIATEGGIAEFSANVVITKCRIINNTAHLNGGVVKIVDESLQMLNCLLSHNTANNYGGVLVSTASTIVITNCIFKMNSGRSAGVFYFKGGSTLLRNSSFVNNFAELDVGVFFVAEHSVMNITHSRFFGNQVKRMGGVLLSTLSAKVIIRNTAINQSSGKVAGAILIDRNSVLELYESEFINNNAQETVGALLISGNSLLVAVNSSFKGNKAYDK